MVRFVSEFGSDSPPRAARFIDDELRLNEWPNLDWDRLAAEYGYQRATFERLFPPSDFDTFEEWGDTTQRYQSHVLKVQIEALRRLKYRPTGGFCFSSLNDSSPAISSSILDADRVPKFACDAVQAACAPVLVMADPPPDVAAPGDRIDLDVHAVSDLRTALDFAVVDVVATWPGGEQRWRFGGAVPADDVVKVGRVRFDAPDAVGMLTIDLTMTAGDLVSTNHYATSLSPA
jgi:beta-mannosidase